MRKPRIVFAPIDLSVIENHHLLVWMDAQCFPGDTPAIVPGAKWWIGWTDDETAAAYCAWKPRLEGARTVGYLYRAGVMPKYRGAGLQKRLIKVRSDDIRKSGIDAVVTCTSISNSASSRSLIAAGFRPYNPVAARSEIIEGLIHWRLDL